MNTGLWKMDSGFAATRRPGMTKLLRSVVEKHERARLDAFA